MRDFEKEMEGFEKQVKRSIRRAVALAIVGACLKLALIGGVIYVAIHFIQKVW